MAWIHTIPDDEWDGELGDLYAAVVDKTYGRVDEIMAIHSLDPKGLNAHLALYNSPSSPSHSSSGIVSIHATTCSFSSRSDGTCRRISVPDVVIMTAKVDTWTLYSLTPTGQR